MINKSKKSADIIKNQKGKIETLRQLTGGVLRTLVMLFDIFMDEDGSAFDDLVKLSMKQHHFINIEWMIYLQYYKILCII